MRRKKYPLWYRKHRLKHITGFVTAAEKKELKRLAKAADKSLSRYISRLLQRHIETVRREETQE